MLSSVRKPYEEDTPQQRFGAPGLLPSCLNRVGGKFWASTPGQRRGALGSTLATAPRGLQRRRTSASKGVPSKAQRRRKSAARPRGGLLLSRSTS